MLDAHNFGQLLRINMAAQGTTARKLAADLKINPSSISRIIAGHGTSLKTALLLMNHLKLTIKTVDHVPPRLRVQAAIVHTRAVAEELKALVADIVDPS